MSWNAGQPIPSGGDGRGIAEQTNGDWLLLIDEDFSPGDYRNPIYTYDVAADTLGDAVATPGQSETGLPERNLYGLAIDHSGNLLTVGTDLDRVYTRSAATGVWDNGRAAPDTEPRGVAVDLAGALLIVGRTSRQIWRSTDGGVTWTSLASAPANEYAPWGVGVKWDGDLLLTGQTSGKVYTRDMVAGEWDDGIDGPDGESDLRAITVKRNGDWLLVGGAQHRIYAYQDPRAPKPAVAGIRNAHTWSGGEVPAPATMNTYVSGILDYLAGRNGTVAYEDSPVMLDGDGNRYLQLPKGTTAERPTLATGLYRGYLRYNTTINRIEHFDGLVWVPWPMVSDASNVNAVNDLGNVTFGAFNGRGQVGKGPQQVARGNHSHG